MKTATLSFLALLLALGATMLYRAPVRRYVVSCVRATELACDLEQTRVSGTQRWHVPLGADASAVVRLKRQRRGTPRVLLYLQSAAGAVFAAEFEGSDASAAADAAAAELNRVLTASAPGTARIEAVPPPIFFWLGAGMLVVAAVLVIATYRDTRSPTQPA